MASTNRKTKYWTESLDEAFGDSGIKGRLGEEFICRVFDSWGWEYNYHPADKKSQLDGIDIEFRNPKWANFYTADIKANMTEYGAFGVYADWLFKIKTDRVFHCNPNTGWMLWYSVDEMRKFYDDYVSELGGGELISTAKDSIWLSAKNCPNFITRRKMNGCVSTSK